MAAQEASARQHDEDMFQTRDPYYEHLPAEEEDPEEVHVDSDTDVIECEEEEDPEEVHTDADVDEPADEAVGSPRLSVPPLSGERAPTPPPLHGTPFSDEFEELTPEPQQSEATLPADPAPPPQIPTEGFPSCVHHYAVARLTTEVAVAEARLAESRRELAAEREARLRPQGGRRARAREMYWAVTRIELRARVRVRQLPSDGHGMVSRADAEEVFRIAMRRLRMMCHRRG